MFPHQHWLLNSVAWFFVIFAATYLNLSSTVFFFIIDYFATQSHLDLHFSNFLVHFLLNYLHWQNLGLFLDSIPPVGPPGWSHPRHWYPFSNPVFGASCSSHRASNFYFSMHLASLPCWCFYFTCSTCIQLNCFVSTVKAHLCDVIWL